MNEKMILEEARYQLNFVTEEKESVEIEGFLLESLIELIEKKNKKIKELDKKDKVIDLMAKKLYTHGFFVIEPVKRYDVESELYIKSKTKEEIKEYFYKKVEEEK